MKPYDFNSFDLQISPASRAHAREQMSWWGGRQRAADIIMYYLRTMQMRDFECRVAVGDRQIADRHI